MTKKSDFSIPEGSYTIQITHVKDTTSKNGNPLKVLEVQATDGVNTYLIKEFVPMNVDWRVQQVEDGFKCSVNELLDKKAKAFIGKEVYHHPEYGETITSKIKSLNPIIECPNSRLFDDAPF